MMKMCTTNEKCRSGKRDKYRLEVKRGASGMECNTTANIHNDAKIPSPTTKGKKCDGLGGVITK